MPRFTRAELESFRDAEVPDLVGDDLRLLFVGINPGLWTAAVQTHFAHPANRFYPALLAAGIIERPIDPAAGMTDDDRARFVGRGLGITNLVRRATARADELSADELREGGTRLVEHVAGWRPRSCGWCRTRPDSTRTRPSPASRSPTARRPKQPASSNVWAGCGGR